MRKPLFIRIDGLTPRQKETVVDAVENLMTDLTYDDPKLQFEMIATEEIVMPKDIQKKADKIMKAVENNINL